MLFIYNICISILLSDYVFGRSPIRRFRDDESEESFVEDNSISVGGGAPYKDPQPVDKSLKIIYQWRNGIVPYYVDRESYDDIIVDRIRSAMRVIQSSSCVVFTQITTPQKRAQFRFSYVQFTNPERVRECVHTIMRGSGGEPTLVLGYDCMKERDIIHALMHLLGFRDEVTLPHRDNYVNILWENIQPKYRNLFTISPQPLFHELGEYDMMSIMHFHDRAYSINGAATIVPLIPGQSINPQDRLSLLDKMKLRLAFKNECNRRHVDDLLRTCKNSESDNDSSQETNKILEDKYRQCKDEVYKNLTAKENGNNEILEYEENGRGVYVNETEEQTGANENTNTLGKAADKPIEYYAPNPKPGENEEAEIEEYSENGKGVYDSGSDVKAGESVLAETTTPYEGLKGIEIIQTKTTPVREW